VGRFQCIVDVVFNGFAAGLMRRWRIPARRLEVRLIERVVLEEVGPVDGRLLAERLGLLRALELVLAVADRGGRVALSIGLRVIVLEAPAPLVGLMVKGHTHSRVGLVVKGQFAGRTDLVGNLVDLSALGSLNSPHGPERLTLSAFNFAGVGAAAALEV
jgi:hypothetical protein